ncbi:asparaginyl-tRNA synthetase [Cokeromyces recurvatus]|uniref:asparaginyl-tRNA synthetase n=1 Tax=Cokeromyces recurvatus TaxID=90255 RepID=UPI00221E62CF|nr:asparaginyl-tRNA synthetase [Cokeromyces recurvatus]KAI7902037.1 asparaginyl-tRNA synthetase [Cokeromyces recurvatus]
MNHSNILKFIQKAHYTTNRSILPSKTIKTILKDNSTNVSVRGWVRSVRKQKQISFATINDGSTLKGIQAILNEKDAEKLSTGTCVELYGSLIPSPGKEQSKELNVEKMKILGECDSTYPLQKKRHSLEFLRTIGHLRMRGNTGSAVLRVRNAANEGLHDFFKSQEFILTNTPILTSHDCEGGGEVFKISPIDTTNPTEFFKKPVYLTVSGQLHAEITALAMSRVYTFGPVFRAEESMTSRHLAEFWMLEAEMAFIDELAPLLDVTEANVQETTRYVLDTCSEDLSFFNQWVDKSLLERLQKSIAKPYVRMTYSEAIDVLQKAQNKHKFQFPTEWGSSLQSEHERYLASEYCKHPVFITDYPAELKPFYMRANEDGKTVGCFDLLLPGIGELVGGSLREERYAILEQKMREAKMNIEDYQWYLDLRKYGSAPHGGYGIGFERLLLWLTGLENVREVIPMPRWVGHCKY